MEVIKTLKPNAPGTKRLTRLYGDSLVAVRYRKGSNPDNIYTTVELVVESKPYLPGITHAPAKTARQYQKVCELKLKDRIIKNFGVWIWTCYGHI